MSVITCRSNVLRGPKSPVRLLPHEVQYNYVGASTGAWRVVQMKAVCGVPLAPVNHIDIIKGPLERVPPTATWMLSGLVRNTRYVSRDEFVVSNNGGYRPGRPMDLCAALIAVRRSREWWELGHHVRRAIMEAQPSSSSSGLRRLSGMVRRLSAIRDLSAQFDRVTWFEYEARDVSAFDELLTTWRTSEEWNYIDRECDIRLVGAG